MEPNATIASAFHLTDPAFLSMIKGTHKGKTQQIKNKMNEGQYG
jgi:hypothetical protein